jgi:uncharacterized protein (TIGR03084 family)
MRRSLSVAVLIGQALTAVGGGWEATAADRRRGQTVTNLLREIIDDLEGEQAALDSVLQRLPDEAWERSTHAPGWAVRDQVGHLAQFDNAARTVIEENRDVLMESARAGETAERGYLARSRAMTAREVYESWREASSGLIRAARGLEPGRRLPWAGRDLGAASFLTARLMECWSHGLDVVDVVDVERPDTDRLRHVVQLGLRTRPFSYANRGMTMPEAEIRLELTAPSGAAWTFGPKGAADRISGTASDFCQVVTQRRHLADTELIVEGPFAREWMEIAQAFAGPPGQGRQLGEFPRE